MLINNWYAAAAVDSIGDGPVRVKMLGCEFVLFKTGEGEIACLSDVCCHRGASLSRGRLVNSCIKCPFHGWEYAADGRCSKMPALGHEIQIPKRARVPSYSTQVWNGLVWVFLGDLAEDERPSLPDIPFLQIDRTDEYDVRLRVNEYPVNWARIAENVLDTAHIFYVHSFAGHMEPRMAIPEVEESQWGARAEGNLIAKDDPSGQQSFQRSEFSTIGLVSTLHIGKLDGGAQIFWGAGTPIDEFNTRVFLYSCQSLNMPESVRAQMRQIIEDGFDEDLQVWRYQNPPIPPVSLSDELLIETDYLEAAMRRKTKQAVGALGMIDVPAWRLEEHRHAFVIPCPGHREQSGNWVHKTIPITHDLS